MTSVTFSHLQLNQIKNLGFKIKKKLIYEQLLLLEEDLECKNQFVEDYLEKKEKSSQDRFLVDNEEILGENDIVKIHSKYFRKEKSKLKIQMLKKKRRVKYKEKKLQKKLVYESDHNLDLVNERMELERKKKPPDILNDENLGVSDEEAKWNLRREKKLTNIIEVSNIAGLSEDGPKCSKERVSPDKNKEEGMFLNLKISNKKRRVLSTLYENAVRIKKRRVHPLIKATLNIIYTKPAP
jgi:hypothetical protein